jgi:serine/threonine protein kinase
MTEPGSEPNAREGGAQELAGRIVASGKYRVVRLIGRGGMGAVYEAEHLSIGRRVAIKFVDRQFAQDEHVIRRFEREARAASVIESDHIVSVFDFGYDDGQPYLVMELLRGEDLGARLRRERTVPLDESLHIVAQVLRGLARAHAAGIVHRDLKPDNVLLVQNDEDPLFVKVVDFGISKIQRLDDKTPFSITQRGVVLGTPLFMSPEQAQALPDIDERSDLYSVGAILFECLSGRPPHVGETEERIILRIREKDAPDVRDVAPSVPEQVARFIGRALARDRAARYPSAAQMLAALREVAPHEPSALPMRSLESKTLALVKTIISGDAPPATLHDAEPSRPGTKTDAAWATVGKTRAGVVRRHASFVIAAFGATLAGILVTAWVATALRRSGTLPVKTEALAVSGPHATPGYDSPPVGTEVPQALGKGVVPPIVSAAHESKVRPPAPPPAATTTGMRNGKPARQQKAGSAAGAAELEIQRDFP